jgi:quercetin dioxygenase-like cupin family protein
MKKVHYREVPPDPVGEHDATGVTVRWVIAEKDGAPNFAMRVFEVEPGGHSPYHKHPWEHEVFILDGSGTLVHEGKEYPLAKGDVMFIPGGEQHQLRSATDGKLEFICLIPNPQ